MAVELAAQHIINSEKPIADYVPYTRHVTENIISTQSGDLLTVIKLSGRSHLSADHQTLMQWIRDLNTVFKGAASDHLALWHHLIRRHVTEYPQARYESMFCQQFDDKYRKLFGGKSLMLNELYLTIIYRAVPDKTLELLAKFEKPSPQEKRERRASAIKQLTELQRLFMASLTRYGSELLGTYKCVIIPGNNGENDQRLSLLNWYYLNTPESELVSPHKAEIAAQAKAKTLGLSVYLYSQVGGRVFWVFA